MTNLSFNRVFVCGNITIDPKYHKEANILNLSIAINDSYKDKNTGEWVHEPTFIDLVAFSNQAKWGSEKLKKGDNILVEGQLKENRFKDKEGNDKKTYRIAVSTIKLVKENGEKPVLNSTGDKNAKPAKKQEQEDDIPF